MDRFDTQNNKALRTDLFSQVKQAYIQHMIDTTSCRTEQDVMDVCHNQRHLEFVQMNVQQLQKSDFTDEFVQDQKKTIKGLITVANNTLSVEEKWNAAKDQIYALYGENKDYVVNTVSETTRSIRDKINSQMDDFSKDYPDVAQGVNSAAEITRETLEESGKIVSEKAKEISGSISDGLGETGAVVVKKSKEISKSAKELGESLFKTAKKKVKKFKKENDKLIKDVSKSAEKAMMDLDGYLESKEERINKVDKWLSHSSESISVFAGKIEPRNEQESLMAEAALNQLKAEQCYTIYKESLKQCEYPDNICLLQNYTLVTQCDKYANIANTTVQSLD
eukprot:TRINITY_DN750_c0_g1_i1.p1 TRINITY_DN750_c0_g1~~TRINITY_DN750_c0_g1_i1.p1  ORF type:complete len:336 (+),score=82.51 TRINITY_DN750_c0_g1_i1:18-1025(+)